MKHLGPEKTKYRKVKKLGRSVTKAKIKKALYRLLETMPADKLTAQMVAEEAHVSKQSLYNNYYGLLGAIEELVHDLMADAAGEFSGKGSRYPQIKAIVEALVANKTVFKKLYSSKYREELLNVIKTDAEPYIKKFLEEQEEQAGIRLEDREMQLLVNLYMDIYTGGLNRFLDTNMTEDPLYLIDAYERILRGMGINSIEQIHKAGE